MHHFKIWGDAAERRILMTISSSLNAGVAALAANATRLASISDNIANASTFGYKRVETDFSSMVISRSAGEYSAGGVRATSQRFIDQRGSLVSTANATDLAVRGQMLKDICERKVVLCYWVGRPNPMAQSLSFHGTHQTDWNRFRST